MVRILSVVPECYVETNMAKTFLDVLGVNHQDGCGAVTKAMKESNALKDAFAIGLIDDDKDKSNYSKEFILIKRLEISNNAHIDLMYHEGTSHYLVVTHPAMEVLMIECAKLAGIDMKKYTLSDSLVKLKKYTKDHQADDDVNIKRLFKALSGNPTSPLGKLKATLNYMVNNTYSIDRELLAEMLS